MQTPTSHARYGQQQQAKAITTPTSQMSKAPQHFTPKSQYGAFSTNPLTPAGSKFQDTPSPMCNPFEADFEHLQHGIMTPGIFRKNPVTSPDSKDKPFQWDIEHVALLNPTDFGDVTEKLKRQDRHSRKADKLAQGAINKFFEKEEIVPSPWSEPVQKVNLLTKIDEEEKSLHNSSVSKRNASSQTDVHIPLSIDFNQLLKAYRLSDSQIDELNKGDSFSNSSLRRKLFGNDSNSSDSLESFHDLSDKNHPIPSTDCWDSPPLADLHASSPVFGGISSSLQRRCSFSKSPDRGHSSPCISPISSPTPKPAPADQFIHSQGFEAASPDLKGSFKRFTSGLSFNLGDEFHLSNSGLATESDSDDERGSKGGMSIDMHSSHLASDNHNTDPEAMITNNLSHLHSANHQQDDSVSMSFVSDRLGEIGEITAPQSSQLFHVQNTSDTGYQSQVVSTYCIEDTSSMQYDHHTKPRLQSGNQSPNKSAQNDWEPPSSSTPNKNHRIITDNTHTSVWHQL